MSCEELRDQLAAYAAGALEAGETAAVESHLRTCREHDGELVELRATALALATLVADAEPSPALAGRIERLTAEESPAAGGARRRRWLFPAAAAVLLAVFAGGWLAGAMWVEIDAERYSYALRGPGETVVRFSGRLGQAPMTVSMAGVPRLPAERSYQLWAIQDGRWLSVGTYNTNAQGEWRGVFEFALESGDEIAITVEPAGGSERPSSDPVFRSGF